MNFASQNVLSLNISSKNCKTDQKILAITKNNNDVILLSDTRLNSTKQNASTHDLTKKFLLKGYVLFHNSKSASRGVCILIKNDLSYTVHNEYRDFNDNYLILDLTINSKRFTLGAVYGPNEDDMDFYNNLERDIAALNNRCIIVSGDWNATWDPSPVLHNIDTINMRNIPSKRRSERINALARNLSLTDPYRFHHPEKREFTFVPNIAGNKNRSRIDFFLISENILGDCKSVSIPHHLSSKMFDHKSLSLNFKHFHNQNTQKVKDSILKDQLLAKVMKVYTFDCYNNHATLTDLHNENAKNDISLKLGSILTRANQIQNIRKEIINEGYLGENVHAMNEN